MMPVRLGEVGAEAEAMPPERIEQDLRNVRLRVRAEGAVRRGDSPIGLLRVEHGEAVVVLSREDEVLHPRPLRSLRPLLRLEMLRIERAIKRPIIAPKSVHVLAALAPGRQLVRP